MLKFVLIGLGGLVLALLAAGWLWEKTAEAADVRRFPPPGRLIQVNGRRLHTLCEGNAPGPTVVIEQGSGSPAVLWRPVQDRIAAFARICTYDRAGMQWSDPAPGPMSLEGRAAELHALLKAAEIPGPYVLVGHSYGGPLIRLFARDHADEVAGMVFVDAADGGDIFAPGYQKFVAQAGPMMSVMTLAAEVGLPRLLGRLSPDEAPSPGVSRAELGAADAFMARPSFFRVMADEMASMRTAPERLRTPGGLGGSLGDRPVSVITHAKPFPGPVAVLEKTWPESQRRLAALSTRSEHVMATKSGHMIHLDEPELVVDAVRRVHAAARDGGAIRPS